VGGPEHWSTVEFAPALGWQIETWAVENATGLGQPVAQQLLAAGEAVLEAPPKPAAKARLLSDGDTNKNGQASTEDTYSNKA
jgi:hypothetical protein